jgi:hypothetical protein
MLADRQRDRQVSDKRQTRDRHETDKRQIGHRQEMEKRQTRHTPEETGKTPGSSQCGPDWTAPDSGGNSILSQLLNADSLRIACG